MKERELDHNSYIYKSKIAFDEYKIIKKNVFQFTFETHYNKI